MQANSSDLFSNRRICRRCNQDLTLDCFDTYDNGRGERYRATCRECDKTPQPKTPGFKRCSKCGQTLPLEDFYMLLNKNGRRYPNSYCKPCGNEGRSEYAKSPISKKSARKRNIKVAYGLTPEKFDAMVASQEGKCAICRKPFETSRGTHIDHVHSGDFRVRGILCWRCNHGLGNFLDDSTILLNAIAYLDKHRSQD